MNRTLRDVAPSPEDVSESDKIAIYGYFSNLPRYRVDAIYARHGDVYVVVGASNPMPTDPPDVTVYRFAIVERNVKGEDVECVELTEVAWGNGATGRMEWTDEADTHEPPSTRGLRIHR